MSQGFDVDLQPKDPAVARLFGDRNDGLCSVADGKSNHSAHTRYQKLGLWLDADRCGRGAVDIARRRSGLAHIHGSQHFGDGRVCQFFDWQHEALWAGPQVHRLGCGVRVGVACTDILHPCTGQPSGALPKPYWIYFRCVLLACGGAWSRNSSASSPPRTSVAWGFIHHLLGCFFCGCLWTTVGTCCFLASRWARPVGSDTATGALSGHVHLWPDYGEHRIFVADLGSDSPQLRVNGHDRCTDRHSFTASCD